MVRSLRVSGDISSTLGPMLRTCIKHKQIADSTATGGCQPIDNMRWQQTFEHQPSFMQKRHRQHQQP
jgi:hypothetical protein